MPSHHLQDYHTLTKGFILSCVFYRIMIDYCWQYTILLLLWLLPFLFGKGFSRNMCTHIIIFPRRWDGPRPFTRAQISKWKSQCMQARTSEPLSKDKVVCYMSSSGVGVICWYTRSHLQLVGLWKPATTSCALVPLANLVVKGVLDCDDCNPLPNWVSQKAQVTHLCINIFIASLCFHIIKIGVT